MNAREILEIAGVGEAAEDDLVVLQSLAAARNAWGKELGDALLDFNNAKIVLGGLSDAGDLEDLSTLLGVREERVLQTSRSGRAGLLDAGDYSWSWRQVPVMRPDEIRKIDSEKQGHALLIARSGRSTTRASSGGGAGPTARPAPPSTPS